MTTFLCTVAGFDLGVLVALVAQYVVVRIASRTETRS
jgi:hypothetical protein